MIKIAAVITLSAQIWITSQAMSNSYTVEPSYPEQVPVSLYNTLRTLMARLTQAGIYRLHRDTLSESNPGLPIPLSKRVNLSINQELKSLAHMLVMRENKRRHDRMSELRSKLISIGKRSVSRTEENPNQSGHTEAQNTTSDDIVELLSLVFSQSDGNGLLLKLFRKQLLMKMIAEQDSNINQNGPDL